MLAVHTHRGPLRHTRRALAEGAITIGFIGGSITDGRPGHNWPEPVIAWFVQQYPDALIRVENAAIGATGSQLAAFRAQRDLIDRGCDLVFVEYAVNDYGLPTEARSRSREGLLRQLLAGDLRDVVLTYTYSQPMYAAMIAGEVPDSIAEFETLAAHYDLGSVWMGLHAMREVQAGQMRWEEWLPDRLHPQSRGSLSYGQSVNQYLAAELGAASSARAASADASASATAPQPLPPPLNPLHWQFTHQVPLHSLQRTGPWILRRGLNTIWQGDVLCTMAPGARLACAVPGHTICLGIDFGKVSGDFRWRLDGGEWQLQALDRPPWCGNQGWFRLICLAENLEATNHYLELEVIHADTETCSGSNFCLSFVGSIQHSPE